MAQRSHVPKFGNWESEENVPYTAFFDKARKGKSEGGKPINPNDPEENPDAFSEEITPPVRAPPFRTGDPQVPPPGAAAASGPKHESREDGELRRLTESPVRHDGQGRKDQRYNDRGSNSGDSHRKASRQSGGSDRSIEQSPLHPHYQARVAGRGGGVSSPSWERKGSSDGSHVQAPATPGRSRLRSTGRGDETPEKGAAVPKFGAWDESDPASADSYTHIFNKVREERQVGSAKVPVMPTESSYPSGQKQANNFGSMRCCCFGWSRK
eukprot:TRINITY_DN24745_c0_g1_i1.p1 TRINITY_DN24745_c0_g1~~TRINITY_DN24745_c0_g1_i1.p1  ORF type:complete len:268 (+),score=46.04 TRINITY_DN24745_c0_g1_i1:101-904(+)